MNEEDDGESPSNSKAVIWIEEIHPRLGDPVDLVSQRCSPCDPRRRIYHRKHRFGPAMKKNGVPQDHKWLSYPWNGVIRP
jgi:transposase